MLTEEGDTSSHEGGKGEVPRKASLSLSNRSKDRIPSRRISKVSADMSQLAMSQLVLELNAEPVNPCGCCYITHRGGTAKFWAYFNLILVFIHSCYKCWITSMLAGGTVKHLRAYAMVYALFCSNTKAAMTARGYCFDFVGQFLHFAGSIMFFLAAGEFKEFKDQRRFLTRMYIASIAVHMIGGYVPQTLFWIYDGHCIPPSGLSLCERNSSGRIVIDVKPFNGTNPCFPMTHTYFFIVYTSASVALILWWVYGIMMAHSFLFWIKKQKQQKEEALARAKGRAKTCKR